MTFCLYSKQIFILSLIWSTNWQQWLLMINLLICFFNITLDDGCNPFWWPRMIFRLHVLFNRLSKTKDIKFPVMYAMKARSPQVYREEVTTSKYLVLTNKQLINYQSSSCLISLITCHPCPDFWRRNLFVLRPSESPRSTGPVSTNNQIFPFSRITQLTCVFLWLISHRCLTSDRRTLKNVCIRHEWLSAAFRKWEVRKPAQSALWDRIKKRKSWKMLKYFQRSPGSCWQLPLVFKFNLALSKDPCRAICILYYIQYI